MDNQQMIDLFGEENLGNYLSQSELFSLKDQKMAELDEWIKKADEAFQVHLTKSDLIVSVATGVLLGIGNALFKDFVPKSGSLKHKHEVTRTAVDYQTPKPKGFKGSTQNLHRQIGPGHDLFRFKEALALMSGDATDFNLWGTTATDILGHPLKSVNVKVAKFLDMGGFKIPADPKAELINHLLIDFFTRRSLPIPGTTYIADHNEACARVMLSMYRDGFNLKNAAGNSLAFALVQVIIHGYAFLFKGLPASGFHFDNMNIESFKGWISEYKGYIKSNEFHMMMMLAHGASFMTDTLITTNTKAYAGLFQLNWLSLIAFAKHVLQYAINNMIEYREAMKEVGKLQGEIYNIDLQWYHQFHDHFKFAADDAFAEIIDIHEMRKNHGRVKRRTRSLLDNHNKKLMLLEELKSLE